jgi:hypothetical protein
MEIIVVMYGKGKIANRYSVINFKERQDAVTFCRTINKLELKDSAWIHAQIISENVIYPISAPFTFDTLLDLDDKAIQKMLVRIDSIDLSKALKNASAEIKEKIFHNMSKRAVEMLQEDIEYMGPVPLDFSAEAQQKIIDILEHLTETGEIISTPNTMVSPLEPVTNAKSSQLKSVTNGALSQLEIDHLLNPNGDDGLDL